jgi:hypothetical protein
MSVMIPPQSQGPSANDLSTAVPHVQGLKREGEAWIDGRNDTAFKGARDVESLHMGYRGGQIVGGRPLGLELP